MNLINLSIVFMMEKESIKGFWKWINLQKKISAKKTITVRTSLLRRQVMESSAAGSAGHGTLQVTLSVGVDGVGGGVGGRDSEFLGRRDSASCAGCCRPSGGPSGTGWRARERRAARTRCRRWPACWGRGCPSGMRPLRCCLTVHWDHQVTAAGFET